MHITFKWATRRLKGGITLHFRSSWMSRCGAGSVSSACWAALQQVQGGGIRLRDLKGWRGRLESKWGRFRESRFTPSLPHASVGRPTSTNPSSPANMFHLIDCVLHMGRLKIEGVEGVVPVHRCTLGPEHLFWGVCMYVWLMNRWGLSWDPKSH